MYLTHAIHFVIITTTVNDYEGVVIKYQLRLYAITLVAGTPSLHLKHHCHHYGKFKKSIVNIQI